MLFRMIRLRWVSQNLALSRHDPHVMLLAKVARLRIIMVNSYFDLVEASMQEIDHIFNTRYPPTGPQGTESAFDRLCRRDMSTHQDAELALVMEYASLKVIWSHRVGNKTESKASIKMVHYLYDSPRPSKEDSAFNTGVFQVRRLVHPWPLPFSRYLSILSNSCRLVLNRLRPATSLAMSPRLSLTSSAAWHFPISPVAVRSE